MNVIPERIIFVSRGITVMAAFFAQFNKMRTQKLLSPSGEKIMCLLLEVITDANYFHFARPGLFKFCPLI